MNILLKWQAYYPWRLSRWAVVGWLLVFASPVAGQEQNAGVRFSWVRTDQADACPSAEVLQAQIARRLGRDPFAVRPVTQTIEGVVDRAGGAWTTTLYNRGREGELSGVRTLTSDAPDCESLAAAVTLAVALAIDPDAALAPRESTPESTEPVEEQTEPSDTSSDPTSQAQSPASSDSAPAGGAEEASRFPVVRVQVGAVVAHSWVPGWAPALAMRADARLHGPWRLAVGMTFVPEQRIEVRDIDRAAEMGFSLTAPWLGLCVATPQGRLTFDGCFQMSVGALHAVVFSPQPLDPGAHLYADIGVSTGLQVVLVGPLYGALTLRVVVPLVRHRFRVDQEAPLFQQGIIVPSGALSLGVHF